MDTNLEKSEINEHGAKVLVSGLPEGATENSIYIHFMKKKHGGGFLERVVMLQGGAALVVFEDPEGWSDCNS